MKVARAWASQSTSSKSIYMSCLLVVESRAGTGASTSGCAVEGRAHVHSRAAVSARAALLWHGRQVQRCGNVPIRAAAQRAEKANTWCCTERFLASLCSPGTEFLSKIWLPHGAILLRGAAPGPLRGTLVEVVSFQDCASRSIAAAS